MGYRESNVLKHPLNSIVQWQNQPKLFFDIISEGLGKALHLRVEDRVCWPFSIVIIVNTVDMLKLFAAPSKIAHLSCKSHAD